MMASGDGQTQTRPSKSRLWPLGSGIRIETVTPFLGKYRPFVGLSCQSCTPKSMESFFYKRYTELGFHNALHMTEADSRFRGWLVRRLSCVLFIWERPVDRDSSFDQPETIYKHSSVQSVIDQVPALDGDVKSAGPVSAPIFASKCHVEVLKVIRHIQSPLSPFLIRVTYWFLVKLLNSLFVNVQLHLGQIAIVRQASNACPGTPLVFLSVHCSWLDNLLLPFLLFSQNFGVPRVAWDGMNCPPLLRSVLKCLGVMFLPADGGSEPLSAAVLSAYIRTFLAEGHSLLIFLESSSPGSRCLSPVGNKWVRQVFQALQSGDVSDILIVPVGISYDSSPDTRSARGEEAPISGVWHSLLSALRLGTGHLSCARVDFAQPFSLQEYTSNYIWRRLGPTLSLRESLLPYILGTRSKMQSVEEEVGGEPGTAAGRGQDEQSQVDRFILHCLEGAVSCSAVMSSNITSALLLHRYREGVSLSRLLCDFSLLTEDILLRGFDVGFSGQRWDLVLHSLRMLQGSVSLRSVPPGDICVLCGRSQAAVRELSHQSAALLPVFLYEALGACAVYALLSQMSSMGPVEVLFEQNELIDKLMSLWSLLPRALLLQLPCQSLDTLCQDVLDKLIRCGLLSMHEDPSAPIACDIVRSRFVERLCWKATDDLSDSDSMEEEVQRYYKLGHDDNHLDFFPFLCRLLCPVLRTYERAACFLQEPGASGQDTEPEYVDRLHLYLLQKAGEDGSFECAEHSLAVCAVSTFVELGVFECSRGTPGEVTLQLSETFLIQENCRKLLCFIQQFVYKG
ncbi:glycerol-3-phosphate acyltransferase 2, mitochondrial-like isoform X2 [Ascaphus truei]|uniref:glycerol-3-phosphate acyltransferase 2, mitochondrial-like isoform X2 n=1 Tax=Ascaphus truei TaxID=8439 RepID=UPI003F59CD5A